MTEMAPEIRVGDRERRDVDALLQDALGDGVLSLSEYDERAAQCWAARTRPELDAVVRDLPGGRPPQPPAAPSGAAPATRRVVAVMSDSTGSAQVEHTGHRSRGVLRRVTRTGLSLALLGGVALAGAQVVTADDGAAVFGSRTVNVTDQSTVEVGVLFGSVEVVVPEDAAVRTTGVTIFGSVDCDACDGARGDVVVVRGNGAFGSVEVIRESQRDAEDEDGS